MSTKLSQVGRPRKTPGDANANGKGATFTRERKANGEVVTMVVHLERATFEAVQAAAAAEERSAAAQIRWLVKQYVAARTPRQEAP